MGRPKRADEAGGVYHMLNRANRRDEIFHKEADYVAFEEILRQAVERSKIKLYSYCVMPNHWHLVVSPEVDGEMGRFGQWLCLTHTQRYHAHYESTGEGHLYQGRFKSFPVQCDEHFLTLCRYVERNPLSGNLCQHAEQWRWSSLWRWRHGSSQEKSLLASWPIPRKSGWTQWVSMEFSEKERQQLHWCIKRGVPFGDETWVESTARRLDLESTMRPRGRPRKFPI
ncbi:transposase [Stieleria sp. ICT_E10.1]|uniref:transposase n=1 Tax=Stieleria sedimenti TaxID=2976331 RepID=UPI00217F63DD|nr:transposase [Stieleria sedimenti]MCS7467067.1 transposase [Stieleria sedimenti]